MPSPHRNAPHSTVPRIDERRMSEHKGGEKFTKASLLVLNYLRGQVSRASLPLLQSAELGGVVAATAAHAHARNGWQNARTHARTHSKKRRHSRTDRQSRFEDDTRDGASSSLSLSLSAALSRSLFCGFARIPPASRALEPPPTSGAAFGQAQMHAG